jgi:hypothetical protein
MPIRRNRRKRLKSAEPLDMLEVLISGAHCWSPEENAAIEAELSKVPLVLERWRRDRKICLLPDDELIRVSEQTQDPAAARVAQVEIRIRVRSLKEQEMQL